MKYAIKKSLASSVVFFLATTAFAADTNLPAIIPLPQQMELRAGVFRLAPDTKIVANFASRQTARQLAARLRKATGYPLEVGVKWGANRTVPNAILLTTASTNTNLGAEGYELIVASNSAVIRAPTQAGVFYGAQTLLQLLPPEIFSSNVVRDVDWQMPCVQIEDWPRFKWRGLMLDVSRHFFSKSEVEAILDAMALHKLNMFHWHLTDDQGWRIEIKKYPRLTQIGAWRAGVGFGLDPKSTTAYGPDGRYGGFYTSADIREVVKYAAARHITIVPEIEIPGHSTAALAAYPELSCTGGPFAIPLKGGDYSGIYNPANDETFIFLDAVLAEVFQLFPGKYVHIGGDEVPKDAWKNNPACQTLMQREGLKNKEELQNWFTRRIEKFVSARGRAMIGWSEILRGGLPRNAAVMDWIGGATEAATAGHDVVMSPTAYCYLDFYQSTNYVAEPRAAIWSGPLTLRKVYAFDPMPTNLPPQLQSHILGAQGNLWTEQVPNLKHAEYMIFPRECALAEITWSDKNSRDWNDFQFRLKVDEQRLDEMGVNHRHDTSAEISAIPPAHDH
jgi:hexosaminidase